MIGSGAAFLVLESREHAEKRGAPAYASIANVVSGNARRKDGFADAIDRLFKAADPDNRGQLVISGASGAHAATKAEREALDRMPARPVRAFTSLTGHLKEAQLTFGIALAALAIRHGSTYPSFDPAVEKDAAGKPEAVLATAVGFNRYEGAALVTAA